MGIYYDDRKIKYRDIVIFIFLVAFAIFVLYVHHKNPPEKQKMIDTSMRIHYKYNDKK